MPDSLKVIDFYATWCKPCYTQGEIIDQLSAEMPEIEFVKIDVDTNEKLVTQYKIMGVPTIIVEKNGKEIWREAGVVIKNKLENMLKS